jgi:hypothetical protein
VLSLTPAVEIEPAGEPPRVSRRSHFLRGWGHEPCQQDAQFPPIRTLIFPPRWFSSLSLRIPDQADQVIPGQGDRSFRAS